MTAAVRKTPTVANGGARDGTDYLNLVDAEIEALWTVASGWLVSIGGTGSAITASTDTAIVAAIGSYKRPMRFYYQPTAVNSTAVTINIDGVGSISVLDKNGAALQGGEFAIGSVYPLVFDGSALRGETIVAGAANTVKSAPDIIIQEQQSSGTNGQSVTTSGAYRIRVLNTSVRNVIAGASLASNQLTLPAGTYYAEWRSPTYAGGGTQSRLFNATDSTVLAYGSTTQVAASNVQQDSCGSAVFTITSSKAIEIDHRYSGGGTAGSAASFGNTEVYTELRIWKQ